MIKKVIVLELKDTYALAMEEGGNIIRIKRKDGLSVGDKIYVLPEDIYQPEQEHAITPFSFNELRKKLSIDHTSNTISWSRLVGVAAMLAIVISLLLPKLSLPAFAEASFDGSAGIQLELDRNGRILEAVSTDDSVSDEAVLALKEKNIKDAEAEIYSLCDSESILIGYASLNEDNKDDGLVQIIQSLFPKQSVVYLQGNPNDIHMAETKSISLGKYLIKQKKADELDKIITSLPKEQIEHLLQESPKWVDEDLREIIEDHKEQLEDNDENDVDDDETESSEHFEEDEDTEDPDIPDKGKVAKDQELLDDQEDNDLETFQNDDSEDEPTDNIDDDK